MAYKKPFKLQSLQKLNNRVIEKDLRALATHLVGAIMRAETTLRDMANKPTDADITPESTIKSITESTTDLIDTLKMLTPMGLRQMNVLSAQQGLTHKSSQEELEAFFKIITKPTEVTVEESIENVKAKDKAEGKTQCNCMACQVKRAAKSALNNLEGKEPTQEVKPKPQVKLVEIKVPEGGSIGDAITAAMEAIMADREKQQKGKQTKMMKIELDLAEVTKAVSAYLADTFTVNVNISELKVVAGREANGARIEVSVDTGSRIVVANTGCGGTEMKVPTLLEPVDEEEDIDNIGDVAYVDTEVVEQLPEPKSETVAPLVEQELKPVPGSFFANRKEETEN